MIDLVLGCFIIGWVLGSLYSFGHICGITTHREKKLMKKLVHAYFWTTGYTASVALRVASKAVPLRLLKKGASDRHGH